MWLCMWQKHTHTHTARERRDFLITQQEALPALLHHTPLTHTHTHTHTHTNTINGCGRGSDGCRHVLNTCRARSPVLHQSELQAANGSARRLETVWRRRGREIFFSAWVWKFSDPQFPWNTNTHTHNIWTHACSVTKQTAYRVCDLAAFEKSSIAASAVPCKHNWTGGWVTIHGCV